MARKKNSCEWCEDDWSTDYIEHRNGYCLWADVHPFNNTIFVTAQANDDLGELIEDYVQIPMYYCPSCGRKLH